MSVDTNDRSAHRDPEALLQRIEAEERATRRGQLKIFLGYASGVGKSFKLFDEGRRRHMRGEDVVVAAIQPNSTPDVVAGDSHLETIPTRDIEGVPVIDVPAVLARHPQVCLVDGLAYDNPPGSRHHKRYEDVEELLEAGISVITSINLEYVAEQQRRLSRTSSAGRVSRPSPRISSSGPMRWSSSMRRLRRIRPPEPLSSRSFASGHCCSRPMWWTVSSKRTCGCTASSRRGARRNGSSSA